MVSPKPLNEQGVRVRGIGTWLIDLRHYALRPSRYMLRVSLASACFTSACNDVLTVCLGTAGAGAGAAAVARVPDDADDEVGGTGGRRSISPEALAAAGSSDGLEWVVSQPRSVRSNELAV